MRALEVQLPGFFDTRLEEWEVASVSLRCLAYENTQLWKKTTLHDLLQQ